MVPQELILSACSSAGSSSRTTTTPSIHLHDLLTSSPVHTFKNSSSAAHSLAAVPTQDGQGGGIFAVQEGKAMVNIWAWQKDQMHLKLHLPEKMTCFTVSPNGLWAAGGSINGHIYMWELASGLLVSSHTAHYRALTSLTFTPDSHLLISTSLDSSAHVYLVSRLIDPEDQASAGKPYGVLSDHTLAVRCVGLGKMAGSAGGRCWTASDDGTVKMWSLHPPFDLLCTFTLPTSSSPSTLAIDPSERFFYVGTTQGNVYHVPLFKRRGVVGGNAHALESEGGYEAVGGGGSGSAPIKTEGAVISTKTPITCLTLSISTTHLLLGTSLGSISIHSLPSHQHLRTLSSHAGPITHLSTLLRPPDLISAPGSTTGNNAENWPIIEIKNLERMKSTRSIKEVQESTVLLRPSVDLLSQLDDLRPKRTTALLGGSTGVAGGVGAQIGDQLSELMAENKKLRLSLEKANKINEKMWNGIVDLRLGNDTTQNGS
ncbi:hypothetical protein CI109_105527 [Kwoniella shandongensis]|uniref:Pre-rRNA-processing protein IPI3 n=1 Tax=Kwoniella shandongensis TaxID=1734106 RepID=A0A5M6C7B5_9TREE|nr:uncharacterized protein CI109_002248 [Kwoniella shandongensis]KAA5529355.1 hypothetical protein CI109_002248 [Kwoniella shandongensis]